MITHRDLRNLLIEEGRGTSPLPSGLIHLYQNLFESLREVSSTMLTLMMANRMRANFFWSIFSQLVDGGIILRPPSEIVLRLMRDEVFCYDEDTEAATELIMTCMTNLVVIYDGTKFKTMARNFSQDEITKAIKRALLERSRVANAKSSARRTWSDIKSWDRGQKLQLAGVVVSVILVLAILGIPSSCVRLLTSPFRSIPKVVEKVKGNSESGNVPELGQSTPLPEEALKSINYLMELSKDSVRILKEGVKEESTPQSVTEALVARRQEAKKHDEYLAGLSVSGSKEVEKGHKAAEIVAKVTSLWDQWQQDKNVDATKSLIHEIDSLISQFNEEDRNYLLSDSGLGSVSSLFGIEEPEGGSNNPDEGIEKFGGFDDFDVSGEFDLSVVVVQNLTGGVGTGLLFGKDPNFTYIATNRHVSSAPQCQVFLKDGEDLLADIVFSDSSIDVSVYRIPKQTKHHLLTLGNSDELKELEQVFIIGTPGGMGWSKAVMNISYLNRDGMKNQDGQEYNDLLQLDRATTFGGSGGPVINMNKEVVGIVFMIGPGNDPVFTFAQPINKLKVLLDRNGIAY